MGGQQDTTIVRSRHGKTREESTVMAKQERKAPSSKPNLKHTIVQSVRIFEL
jgi:hypothetical protein